MFRSTERHLSILKLGGTKALDLSTKFKRKQQFSNHVTSRYSRTSRPLKLKEISRPRLLSTTTNFTNIPLINPDKPGPDEALDMIKPMVPITLPRFPRTGDGPASFPSVTKILQATMPASSQFLLDRWKEGMIKKLGVAGFAKYQQDTFERGKLLHAVLADYMMGHGAAETFSKEVVANLWKSIQGVVKEKISNVRLVEHIVTHPDLKYRGIVDCVACYENELVVIDFKTAEKPKKSVGSLFDNPLQVTAYCGAINNDKNIPRSVIDRNICSGLVIVAYIDGSEASVYYLGREKVTNDYWKQWTTRLEQYSRLEDMKQDPSKVENKPK